VRHQGVHHDLERRGVVPTSTVHTRRGGVAKTKAVWHIRVGAGRAASACDVGDMYLPRLASACGAGMRWVQHCQAAGAVRPQCMGLACNIRGKSEAIAFDKWCQRATACSAGMWFQHTTSCNNWKRGRKIACDSTQCQHMCATTCVRATKNAGMLCDAGTHNVYSKQRCTD
jgi:hypothetical protein